MNIGGMGWAIGAPSGKAIAHVTVGDKKVSFTDGRGYHDHVSCFSSERELGMTVANTR